ncbi:MAG: HAD family hydrolase [Oscillospiraceae bacterium]
MSEKPIFAFMYDFDKTLSPRDMQEYAFIPEIGMSSDEFWKKCEKTMQDNHMDQILAYMFVMCQEAKGKMVFTRKTLQSLGKNVVLFNGVKGWFKRINEYCEKLGMVPEHYIISSGLKEIIEGTSIADEFKEIYAAEYCYDEHGEPCWPAMAVNFTSKTQFIFRINKGKLNVTDNRGLNDSMPEEKRRIPFRNMLYIGDGFTDVPCMKIVRDHGGHSIAVYQEEKGDANQLILDERVNFVQKADYSRNGELEKTVRAILNKAAATNLTAAMHTESLEMAQAESRLKQQEQWERERSGE